MLFPAVLALLLMTQLGCTDGLLGGRPVLPRLLSSLSHLMFSGIVEEMGTVEALVVNKQMPMWDGSVGEGVELTVVAERALEEAYIGCSIAINGVCLTATALGDNKFTVGLAPETLRRTNLGKLKTGGRVNIERALRADGRNSGHFVQGHVDCEGKILQKWKENDSLWVKVGVPREYIRYIVPKGFICIDGTSLTICDVSSGEQGDECAWFTFMLIAHTQQHVIIPSKSLGDFVNVEVDVLAKMVETSLERLASNTNVERLEKQVAELTLRLEALEKKNL